MKLSENWIEFEVVPKSGPRTKRNIEVKVISLGVLRSPPKTVRKSRYLLTTDDTIEVEEARSLGEAEYVAIVDKGETFITTGSDHVDATVDPASFKTAGGVPDPAKGKQLCPAVVAREVWYYNDLKDHFGALRLKSWVTIDGQKVMFQDSPISSIVDLETHYAANPKLKQNQTVLFSGSVDPLPSAPADLYNIAAGDKSIFPRDFHFELADPILGRSISHGYRVTVVNDPVPSK